MSNELRAKISIVHEPSLHFEVSNWSVADAFEDYLHEICNLKLLSKTIEKNGVFCFEHFYPVDKFSPDQLNEFLEGFLAKEIENDKNGTGFVFPPNKNAPSGS